MNFLVHIRPQIEVIYDWMAAGLIHAHRVCDNCNSPMKFIHCYYEPKYQYVWKCTLCFKERHMNQATPCNGHNFLTIDRAIILWIERSNTKVAA